VSAKKLKVTARAILQDIRGMVPPAEKPAAEIQLGRGPSQATQLVTLAKDAELFHTPDGEAWTTISVDGHYEHWPLKVKAVRRWLAQRFYVQERKAAGSQA